MALHIENEALQQIRPAQEGRVGRRRAAERDVIAAAGAGVAPVDHEFVGAEPRLPRFFVKRRRVSTACRQLVEGWILTSITPGSGVTLITSRRGSCGGG